MLVGHKILLGHGTTNRNKYSFGNRRLNNCLIGEYKLHSVFVHYFCIATYIYCYLY